MSSNPRPSCRGCPSYLDSDDDIMALFKRPLGAPMCATFGYVLALPSMDEKEQHESFLSFASTCEAHGKPRPTRPQSFNPRIANPSEEVVAQGATGQSVNTCHNCTNCIKHDAVHKSTGIPLPVCGAKGSVIFNPIQEAKGCPWASPGQPMSSLASVDLRVEFKPGYKFGQKAQVKQATGEKSDPKTRPTEMDVDPSDAADGIRAWFRVECPFGTDKEIFLPIFHSEGPDSPFTETEKAMIPQAGGPHHPELYVDYGNLLWRFAVESWQLNQTLLIQSDPGNGKTEFAYYLGWLMQIPVTRIVYQDGTEWDDVFGKIGFKDGHTFWADGRKTAAWRRIGLILDDEPNLARSEIMASNRTTSEIERCIYIDAAYGETEEERLKLKVLPTPYTFNIWAANPAWDPRNIGTKEMAAADISRISPCYLEGPPMEIEAHIVRTMVKELDDFDIPNDLLNDLLKVAQDIRTKSKNRDYPGTWGIRETVKVARKLAWYPFIEAFRMAALNYFEPDVAAEVIDHSIKTIRADDV